MNIGLVDFANYCDALRNTGYKNIDSAIAEIVDNSIQAKSKDVFIILRESIPEHIGKKYVTEIAFLDNGTGMDSKTLQGCLCMGYGTRRDRKGIGRFGVGLPQASLHVCPRVEVYSWTNGIENSRVSVLDIDKVKEGNQVGFLEPEYKNIPRRYMKFINYKGFTKTFNFTKKGTLVIWRNCDNVSPKTVSPLIKRLKFSLGKKYRHLINDGEKSIYILSLDLNRNEIVLPNDPLFLMENNTVLGNPENPCDYILDDKKNFYEPIFEPYCNSDYPSGEKVKKVKYYCNKDNTVKTGDVHIKFSIIKDAYYNKDIAGDPGSKKLGKYVKKLEGISIVRAKREIDFGNFDFYSNINQPQHRWWGCEIIFEPELDEVFGVSNNKQHVELIEQDDTFYSDSEILPVWLQLKNDISDTISEMYKSNKVKRKNSRSKNKESTSTEKIISNVEKLNEKGYSVQIKNEKSEHQLNEEVKQELIKDGNDSPTEEEINCFKNKKVNISYIRNNRGPFFDYTFKYGNCYIRINVDHIFYDKFFSNIESEPNYKIAFELFISSLVKAIDESKNSFRDKCIILVDSWDFKLKKYLQEQYNIN